MSLSCWSPSEKATGTFLKGKDLKTLSPILLPAQGPTTAKDVLSKSILDHQEARVDQLGSMF